MSDKFQFTCSKCAKSFMLSDELRGKKVRCPKCMNVSAIPPRSPNIVTALGIRLGDEIDGVGHAGSASKYCHYCGSIIASLAEICPKCGVRQPGHGPAASQPKGDSPNKVAACLFAILLGFFGAHRFYLGETMWGVFYLLMNVLLFWTLIVPAVFFIICVIEGLVYLTYSDSAFAAKYARA